MAVASRGVLLLLVLLVPLVAPADAAADSLRPGDLLQSTASTCTLGFVFDGPAGEALFVVAAHCVSAVGEAVRTDGAGVFADVVFIANERVTALDFAFVAVRPAFVPYVDPSVRGHAGVPVGATTASDTAAGDRIQMSGHGALFDRYAATRSGREGIHLSDTSSTYQMVGLDVWGDSGGPLVHQATGKAYGIVSRFCVDLCTSTGPTVEGILYHAARLGFPVTMRTV